jgi:HD-like signal output (HDOD) protein
MSEATGVETRPLATRIRSAVERGEVSLPPLPEVATRVLGLLRDENAADLQKVGDLVRSEPAIAASILRMANSAFFGGLRSVGDVGDAIARLGLRQVATIVTTVAHKGHFTSEEPGRGKLLHALWDHAVATALVARQLAAAGGADRSEAYLAGLLHDTGKLVVLKALDELEKRDATVRVTAPVQEQLMDELHAQLGHRVLTAWRLPDAITRAALMHHLQTQALEDPLVLRVQAADMVARKLGAHPHPEPDLDLLTVLALERLNFADLELAALMVDVEDQLAQIRSLF